MIKRVIEAAGGLLKGASFEAYYQDVQGKSVDAIRFDEARKDYEGSLHGNAGLRGF